MQRTLFTGTDSSFHSKFTFKICVSLFACFEIISVQSLIITWNLIMVF